MKDYGVCPKSETGKHRWQKKPHSKRERKAMEGKREISICWNCKLWITKTGMKRKVAA